MKLLTTEQLAAVLRWFRIYARYTLADNSILSALHDLITAECRAHGYAGIGDAYQVLIEKEGK